MKLISKKIIFKNFLGDKAKSSSDLILTNFYKNVLNNSHSHFDYSYYLYSFFLKKNFYKFSKGIKKNIKQNVESKNNLTGEFLQNSFKSGKKIKFLKFFNVMRLGFYWFFSKKVDFFQKKFPTYNIFFNFSKTEKKFFNLDFLLEVLLKDNVSIFYSKVVRLNKKIKQKNKTKLKYSLDLQYLKPLKRQSFFFKQIHLHSNNYNFYDYNQRLLMSFFNVFFLEKNSEIYKNKLTTYSNILKKNSK